MGFTLEPGGNQDRRAFAGEDQLNMLYINVSNRYLEMNGSYIQDCRAELAAPEERWLPPLSGPGMSDKY